MLDMLLGGTAHAHWLDSSLKYLKEDPVGAATHAVFPEWPFQPYGPPQGAFLCLFHVRPELRLFCVCVWGLILQIVWLNDAAYAPCVYVYVVCVALTAVC